MTSGGNVLLQRKDQERSLVCFVIVDQTSGMSDNPLFMNLLCSEMLLWSS